MALISVIMPKTGAEMEEGRIVGWKKHEGEPVRKGEVLLEIETDKAIMDVESPETGVVRKILYQDNEMVPATRMMAVIGDGHEPLEEVERFASGSGAPAMETAVPALQQAQNVHQTPEAASPPAGDAAIKASPLARRLAREMNIDLAGIRGTGPQGRIEKDDVLKAGKDVQPQ
jgi:pyruvate dehydrogenase E2 component (dihydrolipoamide acetyltransferase)